MTTFNGIIKKYGSQGEKTGWRYLEIPASVAEQINPGVRKSFRVKGKLDHYPIAQVSLLPMGEGNFILPLNAELRKKIGKGEGQQVKLQLLTDNQKIELDKELMDCLKDEPKALDNFTRLPPSHQRYFSKWISSAKNDATRAGRIARTVKAMLLGQTYGQMLRNDH